MSTNKSQRDLLKQALEQRKRADNKRKKREKQKQIQSLQSTGNASRPARAGRVKHVPTKSPADNTERKKQPAQQKNNKQTHIPFDQAPPVEIDPAKEEQRQIAIARQEQLKFEQEVKQNLQHHGPGLQSKQRPRIPKQTVSSNMKDQFENYFSTVRTGPDRIVLKNPKDDITNLNIRKIVEQVLKRFGTTIEKIETLKQDNKGFRIYVK